MGCILLKITKHRIIKPLLFLALSCVLFSCQTTLRLLETDKEEQYLNYQEESNYCTEARALEFSSDHPYLIDLAVREIVPLYSKGVLSFREVIQLYSLMHLMIAPDRFGPSARFQYLLSDSIKSNVLYQDVFAKDPLRSHSSFLLGVKAIAPNSLNKTLALADKITPARVPVDKGLADFLEQNKGSLLEIKGAKETYFKGELSLQEGESFARLRLADLKRAFRKIDAPTYYYQSPHLFGSQAIAADSKWNCSFDIGIYTNSIYLVRPEQTISSGLFGVRAAKGQWFLASSIFNPEKIEVHPEVPTLWRATESAPPAAMCFRKEAEHTMALVSTQDRDPGQHLFHLIELEKKAMDDLTAVKTYLDFTRYLILFAPERIVLESRRASKDQIEQYLRLPIPLYHAEKLGKIWAYGEFPAQNATSHGFVLDGREQGFLSCGP